jgi:hypothetical protein
MADLSFFIAEYPSCREQTERCWCPIRLRVWIMFCQAFVYLLLALPAVAQSQSFSTITIRPARSSDARDTRMQVQPNGDLIASAVPVIRLLSYAYDVPLNPSPRLSRVPDWTVREWYDIEAKAPANAMPPGLQDREVRSRIQQMIRGLLADRFRLVMRTENAIAIDMDDLANYITNWTDLPVVNRTALSGLFTVNTEGWVPMRLPPPPPNSTSDVNAFAGLPTIFSVLGKLGLELKRQEDILPVYTVERLERPAAN